MRSSLLAIGGGGGFCLGFGLFLLRGRTALLGKNGHVVTVIDLGCLLGGVLQAHLDRSGQRGGLHHHAVAVRGADRRVL